MGEWVEKTQLATATDVSMSVELAREGSRSSEAAKALIRPVAADVIKNDETIVETTREAVLSAWPRKTL